MTTVANFLLIPGAGGAAWYWHLVEAELRRRGHSAEAVDLPAADPAAGLPEYAAAAIRAAEQLLGLEERPGEQLLGLEERPGEQLLGLEERPAAPNDLIVVGQSMGGFTVPLVAQALPTSRLVLLNAMIPNPGETPGEWWGNTGQAAAMRVNDEASGRSTSGRFDSDIYFLHDLSADLIAESAAHNPEQSDAVFATPCTIPAWPDVPTHVIVARDDRLFPIEFQRRVAQERLGLDVDEVPGGHLAALSQADAVVQRLVSYLP